MSKKLIVERHAEKNGLSLREALVQVGEVLEVIRDIVIDNGEDVTIPHIGTLKVVETKAATRRNPANGEAVECPAGKKLVLKVSPATKKLLRG